MGDVDRIPGDENVAFVTSIAALWTFIAAQAKSIALLALTSELPS
jgi:hypothetical protein